MSNFKFKFNRESLALAYRHYLIQTAKRLDDWHMTIGIWRHEINTKMAVSLYRNVDLADKFFFYLSWCEACFAAKILTRKTNFKNNCWLASCELGNVGCSLHNRRHCAQAGFGARAQRHTCALLCRLWRMGRVSKAFRGLGLDGVTLQRCLEKHFRPRWVYDLS